MDRLVEAQAHLPDGFTLVLLDCWRTSELQRRLVSHYAGEEGVGAVVGYVSDPDDAVVVPPHTTGGAVDLTLALDGSALALGTDFDAFTEEAHLLHHEGADGVAEVRACRRLLGRALADSGFAPYPWEWWHWSYGDQRWAAQTGRTRALFGRALS
ncbi:MAG TPA: M15 family metallopeptidase [Marmoricola sp.]